VESAGGRGDTFLVDVRDPEQVHEMAGYFWGKWGGIDLLINNAGVAVAGRVGEVPVSEWRRVVDTNFLGMVYGCHEFIPRMKEQGGGRIANIASAAGFASLQEMAPYNTTKAAVISLSETLRSELAPHKIGVTAVCPSFFDTNLLCTATFTDEWESQMAHACFANARMSAEQIAAAVVKAIKKRKLYVIPQMQAKLFWFLKRQAPGAFHWNLAFYNRLGVAKPLVMFLAKHGLI
jgi:NADP-dependent 3-hydroxy acid dehydrogenase YdfG